MESVIAGNVIQNVHFLDNFREFEDHKIYLRDHLISELEEKQKMIETERHNMELTGDSFELKPISTRKLRRRANEPSGIFNYFQISVFTVSFTYI
jgi:hypothetical protein